MYVLLNAMLTTLDLSIVWYVQVACVCVCVGGCVCGWSGSRTSGMRCTILFFSKPFVLFSRSIHTTNISTFSTSCFAALIILSPPSLTSAINISLAAQPPFLHDQVVDSARVRLVSPSPPSTPSLYTPSPCCSPLVSVYQSTQYCNRHHNGSQIKKAYPS